MRVVKNLTYLTTLAADVFPTYDSIDVRLIGSWVQTSSLEGKHAINRLGIPHII